MQYQQLIDEYLANGGKVTIIPAVEDKHEPATCKLIPTQNISVDHTGKRVYRYLNKIQYSIEQDKTTLNYG